MKDFVWPLCFALGLVAVLFLVFGLPTVLINFSDSQATCVSGGYAGSVRFARTTLCVGVSDGEWQIEPIDDVYDRIAR